MEMQVVRVILRCKVINKILANLQVSPKTPVFPGDKTPSSTLESSSNQPQICFFGSGSVLGFSSMDA